jgi:hypothetical protein
VKCPNCGSENVVPIVYGYPTREAVQAADRGELILYGCLPPSDQPEDRACRSCGKEWASGEEDPDEWTEPLEEEM